ncbi:F0F1 ATP synthase subunit epsilon [Roseibacterium sp. SDUM158017]|uniref:F0F1 ATP synthase subunit epsilon n=1 Tax=Roseicyclus salinarum TaxID=3036773 RepID=UPI0024153A52|nr:F0F1 ATP synthase subunit epsilon [Roseibacterium sp. SDUM158017]MDG4648296.1 F0F1 ATP synthase subunit epsilon [Roseibacterium sp. SDUM158017]
MADTMQFDLVSPERRLASVEATEVRIPGTDGDMTAMADHAPTITTLRPGVLAVTHAGGTDEYLVVGGFADISADGVTVLAERAMPVGEMTQDVMDGLVAEAREAHEKVLKAPEAPDDAADAAAKFLADLVAAGDHINLPASSRVPAP